MRKSAYEKLIEARRKKQTEEAVTYEDIRLLLLDGDRPKDQRQANPTQRAFMDDPTRVKGYMGVVGCAKTSTGCAGAWLRALFQPGSQGLIARANYNDLMDTTAKRMTEMLNRLPKGVLLDRDKSPPMKWYVESIPTMSPEGDILCDDPSQFTFMGLTDGLGSYEFDHIFIDELTEVERARFHEADSRLRNIPRSWPEGVEAYSLSGAFNPPSKDHWLYTVCTGRDYQDRLIEKPTMKLYQPQPNENIRNLPKGYYEELRKTMPKDMARRLIEGQWGSTYKGKPVYPQFSHEIHVRDDVYRRYDPYSTLFRMWDFGFRHPVCIFGQLDMEGRLLIMKEIIGKNQDIHEFAPYVNTMTNKWFPHVRDIIDYGDPAARQNKDTGSTLMALTKYNITLRYKVTTIDEGLRTIRLWLERLINHEPAIQFDREGCPVLIAAMEGGYAYPEDLGGTADHKPVKDGFYDHPADAFRYGCVNIIGTNVDYASVSGLPPSVEYDANQDPERHGRGGLIMGVGTGFDSINPDLMELIKKGHL